MYIYIYIYVFKYTYWILPGSGNNEHEKVHGKEKSTARNAIRFQN